MTIFYTPPSKLLRSAIDAASNEEHQSVLRYLKQDPSLARQQDDRGKTLLMWSLEGSHEQMALDVLTLSDPLALDHRQTSSLERATQFNHLRAVQALLPFHLKKSSLEPQLHVAFLNAVTAGSLQGVQLLWPHIDFDALIARSKFKKSQTWITKDAVEIAIEGNHADILSFILEQKPNLLKTHRSDIHFQNMLSHAIFKDSVQCIELLVPLIQSKEPSLFECVDSHGYTAFHELCKPSTLDPDFRKTLFKTLQAYADPLVANGSGWTPLMTAIRHGWLFGVEQLMHSFNPDQRGIWGTDRINAEELSLRCKTVAPHVSNWVEGYLKSQREQSVLSGVMQSSSDQGVDRFGVHDEAASETSVPTVKAKRPRKSI